MKEFKREDYIYLRFLEDDEEHFKKKGDIVRYKKEWLLNEMKGRRFNTCFNDESLVWEKNPDADENDIMFDKVYKSITIAKDRIGSVYLWPDDYLYLSDWLFSHLDQSGIYLVTNIQSKSLPDKTGTNKLVQLTEGCPDVDAYMHMYFNKGETIDFSTIDVATLFYNLSWLKLFLHTEVIVGEEKNQLFEEDFKNAIYVQSLGHYDFGLDIYSEHHYFKIKDNIKVKNSQEIEDELDLPYICSSKISFVRDENSFITHICIITNSHDNSERDIEQKVLKIADKISEAEALEIHKKACEDYVKRQQKERDRFMKEYKAKRQKEKAELDAQYQTFKNNPEIFPGVNGDFVHNYDSSSISKQKYSLDKIKEFFQKLKTLNPEIVKHICFYGGTIPYILSDASESRDFGDIDMFVPTKYMEELRTEFSSQESFEMLCDSKPYAEACMLTTRIPKETTEMALTNQSENPVQSMFDAFAELMTLSEYKRDYIDENGIVHNPLTAYKENQLSYYRKVQDFGFKAKLFGINISVFPIYEYENDIMAKSFNITDKHQFLLGVRVLNDMTLTQLVRPVCIEDAIFYTLPLEYTIVSKQSAVDGKYSYRYEKDKQDVEYILSHKDELGISDDKIQEIMSNYPDYSISIAYEINGEQTTTMSGETYKKLVLTNRNIS